MTHRCRIDPTTDAPFYPGNPGYRVVCDECGPFQLAEANPRDARAVADAHETIGALWPKA